MRKLGQKRYPNYSKRKKDSRKEESNIKENEGLKNGITLVGTFVKSENFGFVIPDSKEYRKDIYISKKGSKNIKDKQKVVIQITREATDERKAEGKIIEVLGHINEAGVDMMSLVKEYDLPYEFPNDVIKEAKDIHLEISKKDIPHRLDLRQEEMFTIDSEDAKDLDDAVNVTKNPDGTYTLGVHIADVSYYVKEDSKLDNEAIIRGTSIYMLDRVIPMLPKELSNGICSLNANEDRLAISVIMTIDKNGEVLSSEIYKSIIHVTKRMTYTNVTKILEQSDDEVLKEYEPYIQHFNNMKDLSMIIRNKRDKNGYLDLDIPESKIILDENGYAVDITKYETSISNDIIEQFMLTANETIAERFYWLEAPFIYRGHEVPDEDKIDELNKFLFYFGYRVRGDKKNISPKEFARILKDVKGKPEEKVVSTLILRTLKIAKYESENKGHFGIASKYYCHFTSPIRRYPDLFIHRVISQYIEKGYNIKEEEKQKYEAQASRYADSSSEREKVAQKVERDSQKIKKAEYMQNHIGEEYEGIISSITQFGCFVELENTVEGLIRFENLGKEYFEYQEDKKILISQKTKITYKIGDKVNIRVIGADKQTRYIDFELVLEDKSNEEVENQENKQED